MKDFEAFEESIGVKFKNKNLLTQAFIHRSYINENPKFKLSHNERLEFLGDAVLELVSTDFLYKKFKDSPEGELTAYRSALVNANIISEIATELNVNEYLLLSKGESKDVGKARQYILANTYEAIVGAIYLDLGYDEAQVFIERTLLPRIDDIVANKLWRDSKSLVQEKAQEYTGITPAYRVMHESGPDHDKRFTVGLFLGGDMIAEGKGKSKQEAEQDAAKMSLLKKKWMD
jgi:ribonuclease-3